METLATKADMDAAQDPHEALELELQMGRLKKYLELQRRRLYWNEGQ